MIEVENSPCLNLNYILDVHEVFEHLHMQWMNIWAHHYPVIPVWLGAKFWKEIGLLGAQMTLWCHG